MIPILFLISRRQDSVLSRDRIIEIGAVKVENGQIVDTFSTFVNPKRPIPFEITNLTSITDEMVMDAPTIEVVLPQFLEFVGDGAHWLRTMPDLMLDLSNRIAGVLGPANVSLYIC